MESPEPGGNEEATQEQPPGLVHRGLVWLISTLGYLAIRAIGCTLRWQIEGWDHFQGIHDNGRRVIYAFWHGRILPGTYFWRNRGIVVMTSRSRDGDFIARVIRLFGYGVARGSSSRGSHRALAELIRELRRNRDVAFTMDGPRGPRYVAKTGATWLAAKTGNAVLPMHFASRRKWTLSSWDHFQIPKPFTRVLLLLGEPVYVRPDATEEELDQAQSKIQQSLDELRNRGDCTWGGQVVP
jgi:lysophospholipid acyltransferase (LPLAT)-like uncharacterized protein